MWIFTPKGFYSVVQDRDNDDNVFIRARRSEDIEALKQYVEPEFLGETIVLPKADYPFRVHVHRETAAAIAYNAALDIDYTNFKSKTATHDKARAGIYHDVWDVMLKLETDEVPNRYNPHAWHYGDVPELDAWFDDDKFFTEEFDWPEEDPDVAFHG